MSNNPALSDHSTPDQASNTPASAQQPSRPHRVLACALCSQRKVKCDRKSPCSNCIKSRAQCVPVTLPQSRRRRKFPESDLVERLRKYEDLLRQNNIPFEPLFKSTSKEQRTLGSGFQEDVDSHSLYELKHDSASPSASGKSDEKYGVKNIWHAMSHAFRNQENDSDSSNDDVRELMMKKAWDQTMHNDDNLLFGSNRTNVDLAAFHPSPVHIFRLWQVYLDNVDPMQKVTHTPSLQGRVIDAANALADIDPNLEALMFGIYCISILSLDKAECQKMFNSSKEDLMTRYHFGCQQALWNCGFLRSTSRDCLTALFFYLVSIRHTAIPASLSSMLGVAVRMAQRLGINSEIGLSHLTSLEAEIGRRLWWALILYDARINQVSMSKTCTLDPTWDCKVPLNVNDSALRAETKEPPLGQGPISEALFAVVRAEVGDFIRHSSTHLSFANPILQSIVKDLPGRQASLENDVEVLERRMEDKYLRFCDPSNPLHFMTIWNTRAYIARFRLLQHFAKYNSPDHPQTEAERDTATSCAVQMLEYDTKIMTSPLTKGYRWLNHIHFPFPGCIQIVQDLKRRLTGEKARHAWEVLGDNFEAWSDFAFSDETPIYRLFVQIVLQAWDNCETAAPTQIETPKIVSILRERAMAFTSEPTSTGTQRFNDLTISSDSNAASLPVSMDFEGSLPFDTGLQIGFAISGPEPFVGVPAQSTWDADIAQMNWSGLNGWTNWSRY